MSQKKFLIMSTILVFFVAVIVTGGTYAYYALNAENANTVVGIAGSADINLDVERVIPTINDNVMIPQLESALGTAISSSYNCIDDNNNIVCQVYKATVTNNSTVNVRLKGTISFTGIDNLPNLKWKRITNATTIGNYSSNVASTTEVTFENNRLIESQESVSYWFVVWIDETGKVQTDSGTFNVTIKFDSSRHAGLTSTIVPEPNEPNLDSGNLIPVYYDDALGVESWKKADSTNTDNSWYDYNNSMWANAVIVSNATKSTYQSAAIGTPIDDSDIIAFYVWIPRYKYRVWNITRQGGAESTYAYTAYSTGIEIEWENGTNSTGNVECTYDVTTTESETSLSDTCVYNGNETITTTSGNTNYTDAWYTHPAFTFGTEEVEGFWIGKFETSGSVTAPTVIPDVSSLFAQNVSAQFTTSKVFQNYLSSGIDAHMLTNLEWGAVIYLTHSIYGLCDETTCREVYVNNSKEYYTGRSGGAIAGSTALYLANVYPNDSTEEKAYNTNGYYNYKGYKLDYSGNVTTTKDITKVASTTGNITGVYDISGGGMEQVMGNMVDVSSAFNPSEAVSGSDITPWNGSTTLGSQYYNAYSYGDAAIGIGFNRARLGDATAEVLGGTSDYSAWKVGNGITGATSMFLFGPFVWFVRGNYYSSGIDDGGVFKILNGPGSNQGGFSFRSSLS